jgi:hypothetical protein
MPMAYANEENNIIDKMQKQRNYSKVNLSIVQSFIISNEEEWDS